jgi:hypothetical protein
MSENPDMGHPAIVQRTSVLSGAKARNIFVGFMRGLKPQPPSGLSVPAGAKARGFCGIFRHPSAALRAGFEVVP